MKNDKIDRDMARTERLAVFFTSIALAVAIGGIVLAKGASFDFSPVDSQSTQPAATASTSAIRASLTPR